MSLVPASGRHGLENGPKVSWTLRLHHPFHDVFSLDDIPFAAFAQLRHATRRHHRPVGLVNDLCETMDRVVSPFRGRLNLEELSLRKMGGTDHLSFLPARVPGFAVVQYPAEYGKMHHTQSDTFDKVDSAQVNQGARVLAAWAYNIAMLPDLPPAARRRSPKLSNEKPPETWSRLRGHIGMT